MSGTAIFIPAIICLLLALQWGGADYPWNSAKIIGLFVGFGLMIAIFIGIQFWQGDNGTLPPRLFKNRNVLFSMLFAFFFGAGFSSGSSASSPISISPISPSSCSPRSASAAACCDAGVDAPCCGVAVRASPCGTNG